jgi:hypothetical protein
MAINAEKHTRELKKLHLGLVSSTGTACTFTSAFAEAFAQFYYSHDCNHGKKRTIESFSFIF